MNFTTNAGLQVMLRASKCLPINRSCQRRFLQIGNAFASPRRVNAETLHSNKSLVKTAAGRQAAADLHVRKWQLLSAVCVERSPVVSAPRTAAEEEFAALLAQQELELSLLSDHELQKLSDVRKAKKIVDTDSLVDEEVVLETSQDREDNWNEQLNRFTPQPRVTEADKNGNLKSINRKLDRKLYLATHQILGGTPQWVFPQGAWTAGEGLRETAERVLRAATGEQLRVAFLGSTPCGWYKYKYPMESEIAKEFYGAKVFFFKALLDVKASKEILPAKDVVDYKWLTREELQDVMIEKYFDRVERFMFEFNGASLPVDADHQDLVRLNY
ncbi:putative 39S ribosomal protein L46, mitochondrial [Hypsibius exemplaris]|uniref:Large ribosomal subunit protein mL46 n=1 Tax=Hypsibius exemplaris TaxID=2072580 RepID=A0A9X6RP21_HYPEX|nr:putative 39S ribosomal protein L46, mitochondrial [Hypsibius exemplaris]